MAIKKKKKAVTRKPPRKAASVLQLPVQPPPPPTRKVWITRSDIIGWTFFLLGIGIFAGHWVAERSMHLDHVMAIIAVFLMVIGAYLLSPESVRHALQDIVPSIGRFFSKGGATAEHKKPGDR